VHLEAQLRESPVKLRYVPLEPGPAPPLHLPARLRTTREVGIPPASFAHHTAAADPDLVARKIAEPEIMVEWSILWPARVRSAATARFLESARRCAEERGWLHPSEPDH
jgi:hypothetical protein